jgi:hypothetical protein
MPFELVPFVGLVIAALAGLNFLCWLAFRQRPDLLLSENERLKSDYLRRFEGTMKRYVPEWLDIAAEDWPEFVKEYRKGETGSHVYEDFVEFKQPVFSGRFINVHPGGFRHVRDQGPWPISPAHFNIFFFGGSTTLNVGPDWTSIPSYFQEELNRRGVADKPVRVYNFGRGSYFSTQERILLQQLLLAGAVPDMAVFLDGVNDFYFFNGRPATWGIFQNALDTHNRENYEAAKNRSAAKPKWQMLTTFLWSLPLARAMEVVGDMLAKRRASPADVLYRPIATPRAALEEAITRYLGNKRQIEAICQAYGIVPLFVWQPTPAYKYDLVHHIALNLHYGLGGHERSGEGYALLRQEQPGLLADRHFLWLADLQENERRPLYLDNMHYVADFSRIIARHIADAVVERQMLQPAAPSPARTSGPAAAGTVAG